MDSIPRHSRGIRRQWLRSAVAMAVAAASPLVFSDVCPAAGSPGEMATIALIEKKADIATEDFRDYWRDLHGTLAVRIPGFWTYTQYHLGDELSGSADSSAAAAAIHGLAEVTYCREADIAGLASSAVTELIKADEQNAFAGTYLYGTRRGDSVTHVAVEAAVSPLDLDTGGTLLVLVAGGDGDDAAVFRQRLGGAVAALAGRCPAIQWARSHVFQPYQADAWQAPHVNHHPDVIYDAALELRFADRDRAVACLSTSLLGALMERPGATVSVYPVHGRYQMVRDGRPTVLGLRGLPAYRLMEKLGAANQASPAVLDVLYGAGNE